MKNIIWGLIIGLILAPISVFAGIELLKTYWDSDVFAEISYLPDNQEIDLYRVTDPKNTTVNCYVAVLRPQNNMPQDSNARVSSNLSCVKI